MFISILFPYLEKILYLDSDTLIFKDLSELFFVDFNHNYILGSQATDKNIIKKFKIMLKFILI